MIKLVGPTNRRDGMSREEYVRYYTGPQTEYARQIPGLVRYYANPTLRAANGGDPAWDSVAEMYYPTLETLRNAFTTSGEWQAARSDHLNGISGRFMFAAEETEFLSDDRPDLAPDGVKYLGFLNRKDRMSTGDFRRYWFDTHVPLALQLPGLRRYRASVSLGSFNGDSPAHEPLAAGPFDGMVEMWFDNLQEFDAAFASPHWERLALDYYTNLAMGRMQVLVRENLVFDATASRPDRG